MARKDTIMALVKRGIHEEIATLLVTKLGSISEIAKHSLEDLVSVGLTEESAADVLNAV